MQPSLEGELGLSSVQPWSVSRKSCAGEVLFQKAGWAVPGRRWHAELLSLSAEGTWRRWSEASCTQVIFMEEADPLLMVFIAREVPFSVASLREVLGQRWWCLGCRSCCEVAGEGHFRAQGCITRRRCLCGSVQGCHITKGFGWCPSAASLNQGGWRGSSVLNKYLKRLLFPLWCLDTLPGRLLLEP